MSCLAGAALIASPALGEPMQNKKVVRSSSTPTHMTRMTSSAPTRITSAQTAPSYTGTRYYGGSRYYSGSNRYYTGGTQYYYDGGFGYPAYGYYSSWPYTYWPSSYYGYYPSWDYYPYSYSYYGGPTYGYNESVVAQVQHRLGELGYYHGAVDGLMGPMTRAAIRAYEATHNLIVDGAINGPLLAAMDLT